MTSLDQQRAQTEAELAAILRDMNARNQAKVLAAIQQYGSVSAIPQSFWNDMKREAEQEAAAVILLLLIPAYTSMQDRIDRIDRLPSPRDSMPRVATSDAVRQRAAMAAAQLGAESIDYHVDSVRERLVNKIDAQIPQLNQATITEASAYVRREVEKAMPSEPPAGQGDTATTNAVTSSTRAVSIGERSAALDETMRRGVQIDVKWATEKDGSVCNVCRTLHNQTSMEWQDRYPQGPPAHLNCRCTLEPHYEPAPSAN